MRGVGWSTVALGLSAFLAQAAAQSPEPSLNVTVRDSRGRIIRGLEAPDFSVTEDGAAAPVRSTRFVETGKDTIHLTLLFDRMLGEPARLSRDAALDLLSAAGPNLDFAIWLVDQKLIPLQPSTPDRKALKLALDSLTGKRPRPASPDTSEAVQSAMRDSAQLLRESRYRPSIAALIAIARANQSAPGRKAIVYFSEGLPLPAGEESLLQAISAANRAGVAVYVVDASGLAIGKEEESARQMAMNYRLATSRQTLNQEDAQGIYGSGRGVVGDRGIAVGNLEDRPIYQPSAIAQLAAKTGGAVIGQNGELRSSIRRMLEDLSAYYKVTYASPNATLDGRFHELRATVPRFKAKVSAAEGFYAAVEGPGGVPLAFETPLLNLLPRAPVRDFPVSVETVQFRGELPARPLIALLIEVPARNLQFDEDNAAGLHRAHLSIVALVRDSAGRIVERFGRDMPVQSPPRMLEDLRQRRLLFQDQTNLAPGEYSLETAVQDRLSGRVNVLKSPFTVTPPTAAPAIEGLTLVHHVVASADAKSDGAFSLPARVVVPVVDRVLQGGKSASATFFFRLYPATPAPTLAFEFLRDGKSLFRRPLQIAQAGDPAQIITLDISSMPSGAYDFRILATQGSATASAATRITIENGAVTESGTSAVTEPDVDIVPAAPPSLTPNAGQQRLIEEARASGLHYAAHLPNFVCTEVTRRLLDPAGKQEWRNLDESAQLVSYYDGQEHYENLTTRNRSADSDRYPPSLTTTGEFGSLLKSIFAPESAAQFAWIRADRLRGNAVQVFSYVVDKPHSQYRVSHQIAGQPKAVFSGFHGLLYIDQETATVLRLTLESDQLPPDFPVRQMSVSLDYGDTEVGGQVYTLPLAFTVDVRLRKRTQIRNDSVFRSYQRFTSNSRLVPTDK